MVRLNKETWAISWKFKVNCFLSKQISHCWVQVYPEGGDTIFVDHRQIETVGKSLE